MAKVSFTKLGLKKNEEVGILHINEQDIEVKQYLPINEKLELISSVINSAADENNFSNPVKENVFLTLEILYHYTNINFTDKQKEDSVKLYDLVVSSGLVNKVTDLIRNFRQKQYYLAFHFNKERESTQTVQWERVQYDI